MENKVLIQGRVTSVEHHVINNSDLDEFTYEFEYNGLRFEGHSREFTGILWETTPDVGAPIQVYFNTDTQKHKIKYQRIIIRDHDEYGNKFNFSKLTWVSIGIFFGGMVLAWLSGMLGQLLLHNSYRRGMALASLSFRLGFMLVGIGCIMLGASPLVEEIQFIIDRKNNKYMIFHAIVVDFKNDYKRNNNGSRSRIYKKIYEYIEDGEAKRYISRDGDSKRVLGEEAFLYKNIKTQEIREEADLIGNIVAFIFCSIFGILFLYVSATQNIMF
ncbi:MAG: hypothetical protein K2I03_07345 [Lachnospiraceae bacterium]|nr:hypothetical protein [Lachnospiraceae bacterium]